MQIQRPRGFRNIPAILLEELDNVSVPRGVGLHTLRDMRHDCTAPTLERVLDLFNGKRFPDHVAGTKSHGRTKIQIRRDYNNLPTLIDL